MTDRIFGDQTIYTWDDGLTTDKTDGRVVVPLWLDGDIAAQLALPPATADQLASWLDSAVEELGGVDIVEASKLTWGESITRTDGRILIPLNQKGKWFDDIELDAGQAAILADMLRDAAGRD